MILFWNNTYYAQMIEANNTPAMFTPPLPYYWVINYIVGLFFMMSFLIGVTLNPFVIMFNWGKRQTATSLLFVITASADFMVCITVPLFYACLMVQTRIIFYNYMYEMYIVCIMCTFGCTSQVCTTLLGICRFVKVMNPFYNINNNHIVIYLCLHILYMFIQVIFIVILILGLLPNIHDICFKLVLACFIISALHCLVGSVCSGLTVIKLYRSSVKQEDQKLQSEKLKSAITIFLMNIPHFITAGCIFTSIVSPQGIAWFDINFIFVPILTSTLNPLLIVTRGTAVRRMIRNKLRGIRGLTSVFSSETAHSQYTKSGTASTMMTNSTAF